ncbi:2-keto-3-deoxy-galactonokinase [Sphingomonas koreensis]|uniref:2-keto-3-deoxy-galactonokinase n=1 Tax=Sphingomonas koreensis TaxID=93064 RepID=A0A430FZY8_9SPHN|nr:2-dehydro-3-deoxygalactonokinase [Sphingomonas koreensis]RSY79373.1 2-keto-3-deoxy-galactonokinase [Sphingomonas koreensis]
MPADPVRGRHLIFGDWGSTALRLALCRIEEARVVPVAQGRGPGIKFADDFETAFFDAAGEWLVGDAHLPVVLAGMIGSDRGWVETGYAACPATVGDLAGDAATVVARGLRITILPGARCNSIFGLPDVMRGEEVQLAGWLALRGSGAGRHLVCLPGTHAKWAVVDNGAIAHFFTSMQGELYDILLRHSLLARPELRSTDPIEPDNAAFLHGLKLISGTPHLAIEHALFTPRASLLTGAVANHAVPALLSGLLIGADVRDAHRALHAADQAFDAVSFVGAPALTALYAAAAQELGLAADCLDADTAMIAALEALLPHLPLE